MKPFFLRAGTSSDFPRAGVANAETHRLTPASPGDWGRFVAVPSAYRARTGNAQICCLSGNLSQFSYLSRLVAEMPGRDS